MAVGDLVVEDGVVGDFVPVDLFEVLVRKKWVVLWKREGQRRGEWRDLRP
jgi:hypothetical protein